MGKKVFVVALTIAAAWFLLALFAPRLANELVNTVADFFNWLRDVQQVPGE